MTHYIFIRFNLRYEGLLDVSEDWLRFRLEILRRFNLPSLLSQTCKDFQVFYLLDKQSPSWLIEEFDSLLLQHCNVNVLFLDRVTGRFLGSTESVGLDSQLVGILNSMTFSYPLVTTRIDSDDIIPTNFVEVTQQAVGEEEEVLSHPYGIILRLSDMKAWIRCYKHNSFATFVCHKRPLHTSYITRHVSLDFFRPVRFISESPMWCATYHGKNRSEEVGCNLDHILSELYGWIDIKSLELDKGLWPILFEGSE